MTEGEREREKERESERECEERWRDGEPHRQGCLRHTKLTVEQRHRHVPFCCGPYFSNNETAFLQSASGGGGGGSLYGNKRTCPIKGEMVKGQRDISGRPSESFVISLFTHSRGVCQV